MTTESKANLLSTEVRAHIDQWILRYPSEQKRSGVFEALRLAQEQNGGHLTPELMEAVADHLGMPAIAVYEVATFYTMYHLEPVGRYVINLCTNISCGLSGANELAEHIKKRLGIDFDETTADGQFTFKEVECLGACINAPVCHIGKNYHENLTPASMDKLLEDLSNGK